MGKIKEYKGIIIIVLILTLGAFYWFQIRPAQARKDCVKKYPSAFGNVGFDSVGRLQYLDKAGYERCLRENGLDK